MCIVSMPAMMMRALQNETQHWSGDPFDRAMVLLDDVVEVFALVQQDINAGVRFHPFNGRSVRAALVDGDLLRHVVPVDRSLQKAPSGRQISPNVPLSCASVKFRKYVQG